MELGKLFSWVPRSGDPNPKENFDTLGKWLSIFKDSVRYSWDSILKRLSSLETRFNLELKSKSKRYFTSQWDSFPTLLSAIGSTSATIYVNSLVTLTADTTTPDNIHLVPMKGGGFTAASAVTLTINGSVTAGNFQWIYSNVSAVFAKPPSEFNVKWWGAPVDGVSDDTPASQAATNSCYASGGGEVYLPPGSYLLTSLTLNWSSAITVNFKGAGMHRTRIDKYDSSTTPFFDLSADLNILSVHSEVRGIWFSGNVTLYDAPGIRLTNIAYMDFHKCAFDYMSVGVDSIGGLLNNFYDCKWHLNIIGFKASASDDVYSNANNFYGCAWTGCKGHGVDYGQGSEIRIYGGECESNGTDENTFTVDYTTNIVTLTDAIILPSGYALRIATTTTLPTASMPTSTFTADNTTDKITLTTALNLPTGYPVVASSSGSLPTGMGGGTRYLIRYTDSIYQLAGSLDNALNFIPETFSDNGTGTLTLTPQTPTADVDLWWHRLSSTTGYICATRADAIAGTSIDWTSNGTGTHTTSFVGTGGMIFRDSMDEETAGVGDPDTRSPGIAHANISGVHFERNAGRALAVEKSLGLIISISDSAFISSQKTNYGRSIYILGAKKVIIDSVTAGGAGDNMELGYNCATTSVRDSALYNFADRSPYPTHENVSDSAGVSFPGLSTHLRLRKSKSIYWHVGSTENAHSIGDGAGNKLTFTAYNGAGHHFAGGPIDGSAIDLTDRIDIISPASGGPTMALESTDTGGRRYTWASGGSAGGAFRTGHLDFRDATLGALAFGYGVSDGLTVNNRIQGKKGADIASANDITFGLGNFSVITGSTNLKRAATTDWEQSARVTLLLPAGIVMEHNVAAGGVYVGFFLSGLSNWTVGANGGIIDLMWDGSYWREVRRTDY